MRRRCCDKIAVWLARVCMILAIVLLSVSSSGVEADAGSLTGDIVCSTNCTEYYCADGFDDCAERCEITKWLQCSSGFGGCSFHETNDHFQSAKNKLAFLQAYGLRSNECNEAMHGGTFPGHFQSCSQCKVVLYDVLQDLSSAAGVAVHSGYEKGIVWTPKEALLHLQRCLCIDDEDEDEDEDENGKVTKFSTDDQQQQQQQQELECFWYAWFERISGGGAVYSVSSEQDFPGVLREQRSRGYHLVSSEWARNTWVAWFEKMSPSSSSPTSPASYWIFENSLEAFTSQLEVARRNGYAASSITYGPGVWFASFWKFPADEITSRWTSSDSVGELLRELNLAVEKGERLQALSFGENEGRWVAWFSTRARARVVLNQESSPNTSVTTESSWIITPKYQDFTDFNKRMIEQGYFATSSAFGGDGLVVAWYDANPDGVSDFIIDTSHLGFVAALGQKLETRQFMATTISYGCVT